MAPAGYFAEAAARNWERWVSPRQRQASEWFTTELDNLRVAFRWSLESGNVGRADQVAMDCYPLAWVLNNLEFVHMAVEALEPARLRALPVLGDLLGLCAVVLLEGRADEAISFADEAISLAREGRAHTRWSLPWFLKGDEAKGKGRKGWFQNEKCALTVVYWQLKELTWNGVSMIKEAKAILTRIRVSRMVRTAV